MKSHHMLLFYLTVYNLSRGEITNRLGHPHACLMVQTCPQQHHMLLSYLTVYNLSRGGITNRLGHPHACLMVQTCPQQHHMLLSYLTVYNVERAFTRWDHQSTWAPARLLDGANLPPATSHVTLLPYHLSRGEITNRLGHPHAQRRAQADRPVRTKETHVTAANVGGANRKSLSPERFSGLRQPPSRDWPQRRRRVSIPADVTTDPLLLIVPLPVRMRLGSLYNESSLGSLRKHSVSKSIQTPKKPIRIITKIKFIETVVYERLPSQAGVHFLNRLPNSIKDAPTPKALKSRLKRLLVSHTFYNGSEFLEFDWEAAQLKE
ncbi:hypothetical protein J6590_066143 [Homalodisca vitripennis]|nr:hypothetical protein J6590_066143 [Homalodisca vitripennis]